MQYNINDQILYVKEQMDLFGLLTSIDKNIIIKSNDKIHHAQSNRKTNNDISQYGTFKDSLRAPIHRWFKYPAGYSYRLIDEKIRQYKLSKGDYIFDPFLGSGTTSVESKKHGIHSIGIEAHPFVAWVARTKLNWNVDLLKTKILFKKIIEEATQNVNKSKTSDLPELVHKCYSERNLKSLVAIRNAISNIVKDKSINDFLNLALVDTLRNSSRAATGWPYISPSKIHEKTIERPAFEEFVSQVRKMYDDLDFINKSTNGTQIKYSVIEGDSRKYHKDIKNESIDLSITSPPYLNNFDYADRTRLETYFFQWYKSWGEITSGVRDKLITSATTQISRYQLDDNMGLLPLLKEADSKLFYEIRDTVIKLAKLRTTKGGKKSYDYLVAGYFSDMFQIIEQVYRTLKKKSDFVLVLGDSAPYGVYVPTHEYLGRIGLALGFRSMKFEELRTRGDKWKDNPQRHKVKLKEVILTLTK